MVVLCQLQVPTIRVLLSYSSCPAATESPRSQLLGKANIMSGLAVPYSVSRQRAQSASKYGLSENSTANESDERSSTTSTQSAHKTPNKSRSSTMERKDHKRQSLPTLESIPSQKPSPLRRRSSPSPLQPMKSVTKRMTKNYASLVKDFNELKKYARQSDGSFLATTLCALCETAPPRLVFFPCQHRCVCDRCLFLNDITCGPTNASSWTACPLCMANIKLMLPLTGNEEALYWKWALEVPPVLPLNFKDEFKDAGKRLRRHTSAIQPEQTPEQSAMVAPRAETSDLPRQPTPQQHSRSRRISQHSLRRFSLANRRSSTTGGSGTTAKLSVPESKCCIL